MINLIETLKYLLPSLVVLLTTYFLVKSFLDMDYKKKLVDVRMANQKVITPIRLQAYERLALLLERITPDNMIMRAPKNQTAQQLQLELINIVRNEFNHNISQQVYVTDEAWFYVKNAKEEIIKMINIAASKMPDNATSKDLSKVIFEMIVSIEKLPTAVALEYLKNDIRQLF